MHVGIVTCVELPEPDPDQQLLLDALQQAGLNAEMIAWDDTAADPGDYDVCVFRSCWNYHWFADAFRKWVDRAEQVTRLVNSARVVHWNLHKCYLRELDASGVPIIPVRFEHSSSWRLNSWDRFHIPKPFSKITVHVGDAIDVPAKLDDEEFEQYRQKVQRALLEKPSEKANI